MLYRHLVEKNYECEFEYEYEYYYDYDYVQMHVHVHVHLVPTLDSNLGLEINELLVGNQFIMTHIAIKDKFSFNVSIKNDMIHINNCKVDECSQF